MLLIGFGLMLGGLLAEVLLVILCRRAREVSVCNCIADSPLAIAMPGEQVKRLGLYVRLLSVAPTPSIRALGWFVVVLRVLLIIVMIKFIIMGLFASRVRT